MTSQTLEYEHMEQFCPKSVTLPSPTNITAVSVSGRALQPARRRTRTGVTTLTNTQQVQDRAEAAFKKKELQLIEGRKAMAEYEAERVATRQKTARLRALRLARDEAERREKI
jgi:hypothetical protein